MVLLLTAGTFGFFSAALIFLVSTPYWNQGILPCILLKVLLVKGALILSPPIALGAFVLGQGTGIFIGKLLAIGILLEETQNSKNNKKRQKGWKSWKPEVEPMSRQEYTPSPSPNFNVDSFSTSRPIVNTKKKSYATRRYTPTPEVPEWQEPNSFTSYEYQSPLSSFAHFQRNNPFLQKEDEPDGMETNPWNHLSQIDPFEPNYSISHEDASGSSMQYEDLSTSNEDKDDGSHQNVDFTFNNEVSHPTAQSPLTSEAENYIKVEVRNLNSGKLHSREESTEIEITKEFLGQQFTKDILESITRRPLPNVVSIPDTINLDIWPYLMRNISKVSQTQPPPSTMTSLWSTLKSTLQAMNPTNYLPNKFMTWLGVDDLGTNEVQPSTRRTQTTNNEIDVSNVIISVVKDIQNLFRIVSFLDINRCLEKIICEVHSQEKSFSLPKIVNSYEGNIIIAFRIIDSMMPKTEDGTTLKYLKAARLGKKHQNSEVCAKYFASCPILTKQLIQFGSMELPNTKH